MQYPLQRFCAVLIVLIYLIATLSIALTSEPQSDEAIYANPGFNLQAQGFMGTTIQDPASYSIRSETVLQYTYWQPPGYFLTSAAWFRIVGFDLLRVRALSIVFGLVAIVAWYSFIFCLQGSAWTSLLVSGLISTDYYLLNAAAHGRMEMMCVGLGSAAFAVYASFRKSSLKKAVFYSHVLAAVAVFSHPASIAFVGCLFVLMLWLDWDRLSLPMFLKLVLASSIPYLFCAGAWGLYIARDPAAFWVQFQGNMQANAGFFDFPGLSSNPLIRRLQQELAFRYIGPFGLGAGVSMASRLKAFILGSYLVAAIGLLTIKRLRSHRANSVFPLLFLTTFLLFAEVSPSKFYYYLPYTTVMLAAGLGVFLASAFGARFRPRIVLPIVAVLAGIQLAGTAYVVRQDFYHRRYLPAIDAVLQNSTAGSLVMGPQYFWFGLWNQQRKFLADSTVGAFNGYQPSAFVLDDVYLNLHQKDRRAQPQAYQYLEEKLHNSKLVFQNETYRAYVPLGQ